MTGALRGRLLFQLPFLLIVSLCQDRPLRAGQPQLLPRDTIYGILFQQVAAFQTAADDLTRQGRPDALLRDHHRALLQLGPVQNAQLIVIAVACANGITALDRRAAIIIESSKASYAQTRGVPPPPAELADLQAKRTEVILSAAKSLEEAFGPIQFAQFEARVRQYYNSWGTQGYTLAGVFAMSLAGNQNYYNMQVQESFSNFTDLCHFPGSPYSPLSSPIPSPPWTVGANQYAYDSPWRQ